MKSPFSKHPMKTLEQIRDEAKQGNAHSGADGQYDYARSLQIDNEDSGNPPMSDEEAWEKAGRSLRA